MRVDASSRTRAALREVTPNELDDVTRLGEDDWRTSLAATSDALCCRPVPVSASAWSQARTRLGPSGRSSDPLETVDTVHVKHGFAQLSFMFAF